VRLVPNREKKGRSSRSRSQRVYETAVASSESGLTLRLGRGSWGRFSSRVASLVLLVLLAGVAIVLFSSDAFFVFDIEVVGNGRVSSQEIFWGSGLADRAWSIFFLDPREIEDRVLRDVRGIKAAKVQCYLPSRVIIQVEERRPDVVWKTGDKRYWVDDEGVILDMVDGESEEAIVVHDLDKRPLIPDDRLSPEITQEIQRLQYLLPEVNAFQYSEATGVSLFHEGGWPVYFGSSEDLEVKVAIMRALVQEIASSGIEVEYVDVRFSRSPYIKEKKADQ
jgi:cell division septal protein FtsQ